MIWNSGIYVASRSWNPTLKNEPDKSWGRAEAFLSGGEKRKHERLQSGSWQTFGRDWNIGRPNEQQFSHKAKSGRFEQNPVAFFKSCCRWIIVRCAQKGKAGWSHWERLIVGCSCLLPPIQKWQRFCNFPTPTTININININNTIGGPPCLGQVISNSLF